MRRIGYAYPWDVVEPGFADRAAPLSLDGVAVALAYHSTRAATPWSATRTAVLAEHAALYRPVRDVFGDLAPARATWLTEPDPGAAAVRVIERAGVPALGWIVLTHSSAVGAAHPEATVENCLGERYPWALCPSRDAVRRYAATLAAEAVRDLPLAGVVLEACGQLGVRHQCRHEKTDGAWSAEVERLLSICCCSACAAAWVTPPATVRSVLRDQVLTLLRDPAARADLPAALAAELLAARQTATDALRQSVLDALPGLPVALHASADPWATGALPGLTPATARDVDAVVVPCWAPAAAAAAVRDARAALPADVAVGAYVTAVAADPRPELADDVRLLRAAGADELHLYHLGLAGAARWPHLATAAAAAVASHVPA